MSKFEDLPDGVRKAIEEILDALSLMTPEQIFELLSDMLSEDAFDEILSSLALDTEYPEMDDYTLLNLEQMLEEFDHLMYIEQDIEPYYEISHQNDNGGEIIVEMAVLHENCIEWYIFDNEIFIHATNGHQHFKLIIPLPDYYHIEDAKTVYRNGLFILPFSIR